MSQPDEPSEPGAELVRLYSEIAAITDALFVAVESEEHEKLDELLARRAVLLDAADRILETGGVVERLAPEVAARVDQLLAAIQEGTQRLYASMAAAAGDVPAALARVRGARARIGGYGMQQPGSPEIVDRRG